MAAWVYNNVNILSAQYMLTSLKLKQLTQSPPSCLMQAEEVEEMLPGDLAYIIERGLGKEF